MDEQVMEEGARGGEEREVEAGESGGEVGVRREEGHDAAEVGGAAEKVAGDRAGSMISKAPVRTSPMGPIKKKSYSIHE